MGDLIPALRLEAERRFDAYVAELAELVAIDSGSHDTLGVTRVGDRVEVGLRGLGAVVERPACVSGAPAVVGRLHGRGTARILLCGHLDTVFATGTAIERPFAVRDQIATGPGVCDDKGGLLSGITAMAALQACGFDDFATLTLFATPDEEVGSPSSRALLEDLARSHDVGLCLEGAREDGRLVIARKGVVDVVLEITGRAAHAGVEPERGINAAVASSRLAVALGGLNGRWPGVTVNVGVVASGERPNVVPAQGRVVADVRAATTASFDAVVAEVHRLGEATLDGARVSIALEAAAPPWEPDAASTALADAALAVAGRLGLEVGLARTGGSADANLLAAAGLPVLDGLGPVGGNDHSPLEWLDLTSVVPRVVLLAGLIAELAGEPRLSSRP
ncbi:M20 family metallopeptidase [Nocardioides sp.]|uniref:M20 family metallopeptidase n=1 Tax=Nocardioides sp. TaxID=35761 RepID=UPI002B635F0C|nr:M20 family metallopeptidase [Nocardioides sp.]HXH80925.1 M20 family metallopeptidase [Nocardioides sp.]